MDIVQAREPSLWLTRDASFGSRILFLCATLIIVFFLNSMISIGLILSLILVLTFFSPRNLLPVFLGLGLSAASVIIGLYLDEELQAPLLAWCQFAGQFTVAVWVCTMVANTLTMDEMFRFFRRRASPLRSLSPMILAMIRTIPATVADVPSVSRALGAKGMRPGWRLWRWPKFYRDYISGMAFSALERARVFAIAYELRIGNNSDAFAHYYRSFPAVQSAMMYVATLLVASILVLDRVYWANTITESPSTSAPSPAPVTGSDPSGPAGEASRGALIWDTYRDYLSTERCVIRAAFVASL